MEVGCFFFLVEESFIYYVMLFLDFFMKEEEIDLIFVYECLLELCKVCEQEGLFMLIDVEYLLVQFVIDYIIYVVVVEFNKGVWFLIYGIIQVYLKDLFL